MSRTTGTLLALAAVVAVGVAGVEVAQHAGGASFAANIAAVSSTPAAAGSSTRSSDESSAGASASPGAASPAAAATSASSSTPSADTQPAGTPVTDPAVQVSARKVPVSVTFFGWSAAAHEVEVGGYVAGVIEGGGTCTLTLTRDGATVAAQRSAAPDATTTTCGEIDVPGSRLSAGTWTAVLGYRSTAHAGAAAPVQIEVTP